MDLGLKFTLGFLMLIALTIVINKIAHDTYEEMICMYNDYNRIVYVEPQPSKNDTKTMKRRLVAYYRWLSRRRLLMHVLTLMVYGQLAFMAWVFISHYDVVPFYYYFLFLGSLPFLKALDTTFKHLGEDFSQFEVFTLENIERVKNSK